MPQSAAPASPAACLARRAVRVRMVLAPQLAASVRGMISSADAMALAKEKERFYYLNLLSNIFFFKSSYL